MNRQQRRKLEATLTPAQRSALTKARAEAAEAMRAAKRMSKLVDEERTDDNVERLKEATTIAMARAIVVQQLESDCGLVPSWRTPPSGGWRTPPSG